MSWSSTLKTLKDKVRTDTASWDIDKLAGMANLVALLEKNEETSLAGTAVESIYRDRFTARVESWSCAALTRYAIGTTDETGTFLGRAARAENDAITALTDARHPNVEPIDTYPAGTDYGLHARAVILADAPCTNH